MNKIYTLTLAAATAMTLAGQSKFDMPAACLISDANTATAHKSKSGAEYYAPLKSSANADSEHLVIVTLAEGHNGHELAALGYDVEDPGSRLPFARLTPAEMQQVAELDFVEQISIGYDAQPLLRTARATTGVDEIHTGSDQTAGHSYTGKGILVGLMDLGMDINHINFLDEAGEPRAKRLWTIQSASSVVTTYDTPSAIKAYETDDDEESHATHVLGIMAGSYNKKPSNRDNGKIAYKNADGGLVTTFNTKMPYYGVAKDAEPAVCIGTLEGNNIQLAVQKITEYANSIGKPAVINLSLGNNRGPHDGTDASSQKLAEYGKQALICISAGNEGDYNISLNKKFTASDNTLKTTASTSAQAKGYIDIWGDNAKVLSVTFVAIDKTNGQIKYQYELNRNTQGSKVIITGNAYTAPDYIHNDAFNNAFGSRSALTMASNLSTSNNRYNIYITLDLQGSKSSNIVPGFIVKGDATTGVNMFAGSSGSLRFYSNNIEGYVNGNKDNTINGMACGDNVLVVGSYNNETSVPSLSGLLSLSVGQVGEISSFSSTGTTFQGRRLPDVVGPGAGMISSYNKYYINAGNEDANYMSAWVNNSKKQKEYWGQMSGTSMSSPFVAGVLALWLEADPTLTMDRVKEIIRKTADHDQFTAMQPERWGMGKINAIAGLKEILGTGSVNTVEADDAADKMIIEPLGGKRYSVFVGGTDGFTANLYNLQGALVATAASDGDTAEMDASPFADGIYLLEVTGKNLHASRKFVVK